MRNSKTHIEVCQVFEWYIHLNKPLVECVGVCWVLQPVLPLTTFWEDWSSSVEFSYQASLHSSPKELSPVATSAQDNWDHTRHGALSMLNVFGIYLLKGTCLWHPAHSSLCKESPAEQRIDSLAQLCCSSLSQRQSHPIQEQGADIICAVYFLCCSSMSQRQSRPIPKQGESS